MGREIGEKCNIADIFRYDFSIFFRGCKQPKSVHILKRLQIYIIFIKLYTYLPFFLSIFAADIIYYIITF